MPAAIPAMLGTPLTYTVLYDGRPVAGARVIADMTGDPDAMDAFVADFSACRLDEVLGAWKPYADVVEGSLRRTCAKWGVDYRDSDAAAVYAAVPTWGPHADVVEPLKRVAAAFPMVILSKASASSTNRGAPRPSPRATCSWDSRAHVKKVYAIHRPVA